MPTLPDSKFTEGFLIGLGLFSALGPKDSLILQQGLSGRVIWRVVWLFVLADIVLIVVGMTGVGAYLEKDKKILSLILASGAIYLVWFGCNRLCAAIRDRSEPLQHPIAETLPPGLMRTAMVLAFANPYAWIDTVVIIGAIGGGQLPAEKLSFATGAMSASLIWFNALAYGSVRFKVLFHTRMAWRALDLATALMMFYLATVLFMDVLRA